MNNAASGINEISPADLEIIKTQLGYVPTNLISVAARDPVTSDPTVLKLYPLKNDTEASQVRPRNRKAYRIFPTIYWLCCPILKVRISKLEAAGQIQRGQELLDNDTLKWQESLQKGHKAYAKTRWDLLATEDKKYLIDKGMDVQFNATGIAGMKNFQAIKCLHTHYAHFLAESSENPIGAWTHTLILNQT